MLVFVSLAFRISILVLFAFFVCFNPRSQGHPRCLGRLGKLRSCSSHHATIV
ncbi:hypothetical protein BDV38DRAFT_233844 [Aspergillus pseudotamarii]|uniref:Uncharacterized protein n=1 Tax=Aspergillus pseudotamarii TaxID=132259 RepID=A0A5N6TB40_ASPPS|nr:uncharacterized protein BDV38DRAFT_233844 [Aspergillus pseudotamarii]KAE8143506.1 hypothetical protein BDV38DRAFT_233844 [Aspergillus pseudotamarii]